MLKEGQPQLPILKLRFSVLNLCGSPAPAPPISMLTHDVCVFCFFSLALPCLNIEIWGAGARLPDGLQVGLSLSIESCWGV
jgi:hypothetical protein